MATRRSDIVGYAVVAAICAVAWLGSADGGGPLKMQLLVNLAVGLDSHNDAFRPARPDGCQMVARVDGVKVPLGGNQFFTVAVAPRWRHRVVWPND